MEKLGNPWMNNPSIGEEHSEFISVGESLLIPVRLGKITWAPMGIVYKQTPLRAHFQTGMA